MSTQTYLPGATAKANISVTAPAGYSISVAVILANNQDGSSPVAGFPTAQSAAQVSTGSAISYPTMSFTVPSTGGPWYAGVVLYVNGVYYSTVMPGQITQVPITVTVTFS